MKTTAKNLAITEELATKFKASYSLKMGGTQTIEFPNGESFFFDDKKFYSGRGEKYNSSIRHQDLGTILVSKEELKKYVNRLNEIAVIEKEYAKEKKATVLRIATSKKEGVYSINENGFIELSDNERQNNTFDAERLAKTFKISIEDARLLHSEGKTYVFAKSEDGNVYELYHADLSCNNLNIWVGIATPERISEFEPSEWQNATYASLVGQTKNNHHFVC
jgi:hypothetical protein